MPTVKSKGDDINKPVSKPVDDTDPDYDDTLTTDEDDDTAKDEADPMPWNLVLANGDHVPAPNTVSTEHNGVPVVSAYATHAHAVTLEDGRIVGHGSLDPDVDTVKPLRAGEDYMGSRVQSTHPTRPNNPYA